MDKKSLQTLEFDKILLQLAQFTQNEPVRNRIVSLQPTESLAEANALQEQTASAVGVLLRRGNPPGMKTTDVTPSVMRAERGGVLSMRELASTVPVIDDVLNYAVALVSSTHPELEGASATAKKYVKYGASPRAAQALITAAKVRALMNGNYNVSYADIDALAYPVFRHRVKLNYSALNDKLTIDDVIATLIKENKKNSK